MCQKYAMKIGCICCVLALLAAVADIGLGIFFAMKFKILDNISARNNALVGIILILDALQLLFCFIAIILSCKQKVPATKVFAIFILLVAVGQIVPSALWVFNENVKNLATSSYTDAEAAAGGTDFVATMTSIKYFYLVDEISTIVEAVLGTIGAIALFICAIQQAKKQAEDIYAVKDAKAYVDNGDNYDNGGAQGQDNYDNNNYDTNEQNYQEDNNQYDEYNKSNTYQEEEYNSDENRQEYDNNQY